MSSSAQGDNTLLLARTEGGASSSSSAQEDNSGLSSAQGGDRQSPSTPGDSRQLSQQGGQADGTVIPLALQEKRGGAAQGGLIPREQLAIDGTVRPPALQEKRVAAQEAVQEVSLFPREQLTRINRTVRTAALQEEGGAAQEAAQEGGLLLCRSCMEDRVTCELSLAQEAEQDGILFPHHIKQLARYSARGAAHQGGPSLSLPTKYSLRHTAKKPSLSV